MKANGKLPAAYMNRPERLLAEIEKCDEALTKRPSSSY